LSGGAPPDSVVGSDCGITPYSETLGRALDNFSTEEYVTSSVLGQGIFDSPSLTLVKGKKIHFKAFGVIFLHNKFDKTYQAGHFHKNVFL
jgi:hypothetical protein